MTQTNQEKLDEMYELVKENNEILSGLLRRERISNFFRIMYWIMILGTIFGVYYYIQPIIQSLTFNLQSVQSGLNKLNEASGNLPEVGNLRDFLNSLIKK
jgi:uncharacterized protein YjgD (DUF1641 family)